MKSDDLALQLFSSTLIIASLGFAMLHHLAFSITCYVLGILTWLVMYGESLKK